jgi:hypothetical protein
MHQNVGIATVPLAVSAWSDETGRQGVGGATPRGSNLQTWVSILVIVQVEEGARADRALIVVGAWLTRRQQTLSTRALLGRRARRTRPRAGSAMGIVRLQIRA